MSNFDYAFNHFRPAIGFAYLRFILNGLTTYQVMHNLPESSGTNRCIFGCPTGEDCLKHYWSCHFVKEAFTSCVPGQKWDNQPTSFFILGGTATHQQLAPRLRFLYSLYLAYNKVKHLPADSCNPVALIKEFYQISSWSS